MIDLKCSGYCRWTTVNFSAKVDVVAVVVVVVNVAVAIVKWQWWK